MISVVIPAYNAVSYLKDCLGSLPSEGLEVIVIDDGSMDGTADLVRASFPWVRLICQENRGVSAARNVGIEAARGDYVFFVDADDSVFPGVFPELEQAVVDGKADILVMRSFCASKERYPWLGRFHEGVCYTSKELGGEGYVRGSVCGCAFRRQYLQDKVLLFDKDLSIAEDTVFFARAVSAGGSILFRDIRFYAVSVRPDSAFHARKPGFLRRYGRALTAASDRITDPLIRTRTCLSLIQGITEVGIRMSVAPAAICEEVPIASVLPLRTEGLGSDRFVVWILNASYPIFYGLKKAVMRLRG